MAGYLKKTNCRIRFGAIGAVVLLASLCGSCSGGTQDALAAAEQQIRAAGQPLTLDELNAYYPEVPIDQNAAFVYGEAADVLLSVDPGAELTNSLFIRIRTTPQTWQVDAGLRAELDAHVTKCSRVLSTLDRALQRPNSRYSIDLRRGAINDYDYLTHLRPCARVQALRGTLALANGDSRDFVHSQMSMLHIAGSLRDEPLMISQLVRISIHSETVEMLAAGLSSRILPADQLSNLDAAYRDAPYPEAFPRAFAGERCFVLDGLAKLGSEQIHLNTEEMAQLREWAEENGSPIGDPKYAVREQLTVIEVLGPLVNASNVSWPDRMALGWEAIGVVTELPDRHVNTKISVYELLRAVQAFCRETAQLRMARTGLAVERFLNEYGDLPESLDELVPKFLPTPMEDPFDGQALRYSRTANGYRVYSVCQDLQDDGGMQGEFDEYGEWRGDWVFEVRR